MKGLELVDIVFGYEKGIPILEGLDLRVEVGEIASLLGSSGSGKTTVLNLIAGFLRPTKGRIILNGKEITDLPARKRGVGFVFQDYALFPHMNVEKNISYGIKSGTRRSREVVRDLLGSVGLKGYGKRSISELSGGEKQRVALARTLAYDPKIVLLDEPLSALDARLREELRGDVRNILKEKDVTALYVTHDQMESISISDTVHFLKNGKIHESGNPVDIYRRPTRLETASFMGVENIIDTSYLSENEFDLITGRPAHQKIGFRPENATLEKDVDGLSIKGSIRKCDFRGRDYHVVVGLDDGSSISVFLDDKGNLTKGSEIEIKVPWERIFPLSD